MSIRRNGNRRRDERKKLESRKKGSEKIRAFIYKVLLIGLFTWHFAFLRECKSYLVKTGNVRIRSDMFRCTRWFGVNYFHRDKQRPMVKKVFPETNYTNPLYSVCDIRDIIYKISRKSLDIECEICFPLFFFRLSFYRNYLFASSLWFFSLSLRLNNRAAWRDISHVKLKTFFHFVQFRLIWE